MNPWLAAGIITWVAIVVCYLGLAAVLREVRILRHQVSRLSFAAGQLATAGPREDGITSTQGQGLRLPAVLEPSAEGHPQPAVVLAATSGCPLCRVALQRVGELGPRLAAPVTLLTYEDHAAWGDLPSGVRVVRDDEAWSEIAHLAPPALLRVAATGAVTEIQLPVGAASVDETLASWGLLPQPSGKDMP